MASKKVAVTRTLFGTVEIQKDFDRVTREIETQHVCPSCGYEFSKTFEISKRRDFFSKKNQPIALDRNCPKCRHEWSSAGEARRSASFGKRGAQAVHVRRPGAVAKPPYRVPLMREIEKIPWNGFTAVSTFSGCGGSSLGYRMAGFKVLWASEFIEAARETYRANSKKTIIDARDVRLVKPEDVLKAIGMKKGELDLFDGSPPCSSFSTAGKREKGWGEEKKYSDGKQRTDDLFFEYVRLLRGIMPKTFVAENVSGLVKGTAKGYFKMIMRELEESGYEVAAKVLDAQWLGVPQSRQRVIFVGVRKDLVDKHGVHPAHPDPLPYSYSVRDAIPGIVRFSKDESGARAFDKKLDASSPAPTLPATVEGGSWPGYFVEVVKEVRTSKSSKETYVDAVSLAEETARVVHGANGNLLHSNHAARDSSTSLRRRVGRDGRRRVLAVTDVPCPSVTVSGGASHLFMDVVDEKSLLRGAVGAEWDKLKPGEQSQKYFNLVKPGLDDPSPAVTAVGGTGAASVCHPLERRKFTIAELRRICAFPDDFVLTGTFAQQWERMGRAVPPVMAGHVARVIRDEILAKIPRAKKPV